MTAEANPEEVELQSVRDELAREMMQSPTTIQSVHSPAVRPSPRRGLSHKRMTKTERLEHFRNQSMMRASFVRKHHSPDEKDALPAKLAEMTLSERCFYKLGQYSADYPWVFIFTGVLCMIGCLIMNIEAQIEEDITAQWVPVNNRVEDEMDYVSDHVEEDTLLSVDLLLQVNKDNDGGNILDTQHIKDVLDASQAVRAIETVVDDVTYTFEDMCDVGIRYVFQCIRSTVLDCFQEGTYDFPMTHTFNINLGELYSFYDLVIQGMCSEASSCADAGVEVDTYLSTYNFCIIDPMMWILTTLPTYQEVRENYDFQTHVVETSESLLPPPDMFGRCRPFLEKPYEGAPQDFTSLEDMENQYRWVALLETDLFFNIYAEYYYDGTNDYDANAVTDDNPCGCPAEILGNGVCDPECLADGCSDDGATEDGSYPGDCALAYGMDTTEGRNEKVDYMLSVIFPTTAENPLSPEIRRDNMFLDEDFEGATQEMINEAMSNNCPAWDGSIQGIGVSLPKPIPTRLGGIQYDASVNYTGVGAGSISSARSTITGFQVSGPETLKFQWDTLFSTHKGKSTEDVEEILEEYKRNFMDLVKDMGYRYSDFYGLSSNAFGEVIAEHTFNNLFLSLVGFVIMMFYVNWALTPVWSNQPRRLVSRFGVSVGGVLLMVFSSAAGLGFGAICGVKYNITTLQIIPFLTVGLGLTDFFILAHAYRYYDIDRSVTAITGDTLVQVGPSLVLTSSANFIAFLIGRATPLPLVIHFCTQCAIIIVFNLFVILFMCPAVLSLDAQRMRDKKLDMLCCIKMQANFETIIMREGIIKRVVLRRFYFPFVTSWFGSVIIFITSTVLLSISVWGFTEVELGFDQAEFLPYSTHEYAFMQRLGDHFAIEPFVVATGRMDYEKHQGDLLALFDRVSSTTFISPPSFTWVEGFLHWGMPCGMDAWDYTQGDDPYPVLQQYPEYYHPNVSTADFCATHDLTQFYNQKCSWDYPTTFGLCGPRRGCFALPITQQLEWDIPIMDSYDEETGTYSYRHYVYTDEGEDTRYLLDGLRYPEFNFYECLQLWLDSDNQVSPYKGQFFVEPNSQLPVRKAGKLIYPMEYSEMPFLGDGLITTQNYLDNIDEVRDAIDASPSGVDAFPAGPPFAFYEQYFFIESLIWQNIGTAFSAMFAISTVFFAALTKTNQEEDRNQQRWSWRIVLASMYSSFLLVLTIVLTACEVYGFMALAHIEISAIPAVSIILAVGITFVFSAHMMLVFLHSHGTREERLMHALEVQYQPTIDGSIATTIGVVMLGFSSFGFIFEYFFCVYLLIIMFGAFNGLTLLPILLSFMGPPPLSERESVEERMQNMDTRLKELEAQELMEAIRV
eukprot:Rmarinus@m.23585